MNALVAYASQHGSTEEIARYIAQQLRPHVDCVAVQHVDDITTMDEFDTVILGAPVYGGMVAQNMLRFIHQQRYYLETKFVYFWATCLRIVEPDGYEYVMKHYIPADLYTLAGLRDVTAFAGRAPDELNPRSTVYTNFDPDYNPRRYNGDYRNWRAIQTWTKQIAQYDETIVA